MAESQLIDTWGRPHSNLRISVTDRCNIRCIYCMPSEVVTFRPKAELLTYEEIERFVRIVAPLGIDRLRITGGEPLVRTGIEELIERFATIVEIKDIAMTTNGMLLKPVVGKLRRAGLKRLNISLDCLDDETFFKISRRRGIDQVIEGILAAQQTGFERIRLNTVVIPGINDHAILPLTRFARAHRIELRFIEFMPLNAEGTWRQDQVVSGAQMRQRISAEMGPLRPLATVDPSQPARDYQFEDGLTIGFVDSVTQPFCSTCNRLRITAEGELRNCLFSDVGWDARRLLRDPTAGDEDIRELVRDCVGAKKAGHGMDSESFVKPRTAMYQIGG